LIRFPIWGRGSFHSSRVCGKSLSVSSDRKGKIGVTGRKGDVEIGTILLGKIEGQFRGEDSEDLDDCATSEMTSVFCWSGELSCWNCLGM
jgi:hypothetical protein